jgi:hypothetical protein
MLLEVLKKLYCPIEFDHHGLVSGWILTKIGQTTRVNSTRLHHPGEVRNNGHAHGDIITMKNEQTSKQKAPKNNT